MYQAPLHRRILPWLYAFVFLLLAPLLLFYTAGYRYNSKKGQVERNGALIVDSSPKGAEVFLDGQDTQEKTPVTFQNTAPGWHTVRLTKAGYYPWEKRLEITAERVTFASGIWLWRTATPKLAMTGDVRRTTEDPLREKLALILNANGQPAFTLWDPASNSLEPLPIPGANSSTAFTLRWDAGGGAVILNGLGFQDRAWWADSTKSPASMDQLPAGLYYWSNRDLIGTNGTTLFQLNPRTDAFSRELLAPGVLEEDPGFTLQAPTGTNSTITFAPHSFRKRLLSLPPGNWRAADVRSPYILLKDQNRWLAVQPGAALVHAGEGVGDFPRWLPSSQTTQALLLNGNELFDWNLGEDPSLLSRHSEPLVQALWHQSGSTIFVATKNRVLALELDARNGRLMTPLADFKNIKDLAILGGSLYIAGTKDGQTGLWELPIE